MSAERSAGNRPEIEGGSTWFTWDANDALPPMVRRALAFAPYDYGCGWLVEQLAAGGWPERVARGLVREASRHVGREARRVYGPQHPQAAA